MKSALLLPERREGKTKVMRKWHLPLAVLKLKINLRGKLLFYLELQQYPPLAVCAEGCEIAEEQSDDEARISLT